MALTQGSFQEIRLSNRDGRAVYDEEWTRPMSPAPFPPNAMDQLEGSSRTTAGPAASSNSCAWPRPDRGARGGAEIQRCRTGKAIRRGVILRGRSISPRAALK